MPRVLILSLFLVFFWMNIVNAGDVNILTYIGNDNLSTDQVVSLVNGVDLKIPANSLNRPSRISLSRTKQLSTAPENSISNVFSWQILDANIITPLFLTIKDNFSEDLVSIYQKIDGNWQEVNYEYINNSYQVLITDNSGSIVITKKILSEYEITLDAKTVAKGYPVKTPDGYFEFYILPEIFTKEVTIHIKPLSPKIYLPPNGLIADSPIYYFYIDSNETINKNLAIDLHFANNNKKNKEIYYWNNQNSTWHISPSETNYKNKSVRTFTHQKEMIISVFSGKIMEQGVASWYVWKNGNFAASPDYPKGTKLKITNIDNGKSVIIEVNDYGPDRSIHPQRVIDLDKVAFAKIANPRAGLINVSVEQIYFK